MPNFFIALLVALSVSLGAAGQVTQKAKPKAPVKTTAKPRAATAGQRKTTTASMWTEEDRANFIATCVPASRLEEGQAKPYCTCMLGKIEKLYPNPADADKKLTAGKATVLAKTCLLVPPAAGGWSATDKAAFLKECAAGATKTLGADSAKTYCACMQTKIQAAYPNATDVDKMTDEEVNTWAAECKGE